MPLFNPKTVEAALRAFDFRPSTIQLTAAQHWSALMRDEFTLRQKETALEGDFSRYVVQDILGYHSFDASGHATVSVKLAVGSGEVDLALGNFSADRTEIVAPFELKGPMFKNLDAIMPGRAKTPVQQAWEYANDAIGARWVIVSNQRSLRLYAIGRGRRDFEIFDLEQLDDPSLLKRFVLLLGAEQLLGGGTLALLERSLREDKDITNKLYKEYRTVRDNLINFIRSSHTEIPAEDAVRLAQKILDRVIFIAFAEDTVLLPDDSLTNALNFCDPYGDPKPKWEYLKRLFDAVDQGNQRLQIPPYNGGLFASDSQLNDLRIPDHVSKQFDEIVSYDFRSQVSVTILGHIFEQSISDIEQKHAEIRGESLPSTTKRKREGVVYTPEFVTRFIVEYTIGAHLHERMQALIAEHAEGQDAEGALRWRGKRAELKFWRAYLDYLTGLRILDPACGSGAFLIAAFDFLKAEQDRVRERLSELEPGLLVHSTADTDIEIITRNLYGVDVNAESVEITKLSLWLKTAKRGRQLESLDHTIRWGNSLIEDADYHRRAFLWKSAFPDVFADGGFDIVIGNPPYVRMELIKPFKSYLENRYEVVSDRADLYAYFFELGIRLLKPGGRLGYISSSTFFRTRAGEPLRRYVIEKSEVEVVVDFGDSQIFERVTTYPIIITLRRRNGRSSDDRIRFFKATAQQDDLSEQFPISNRAMPRDRLGPGSWRFESDRQDALRRKLAAGRKTLSNVYGQPLYGIKSGFNKAFIVQREKYDALMSRDSRSSELLKPYLMGEDLRRWYVEDEGRWIIYTPKNRIDIEEFPAIRDHLAQYRDVLQQRATKQNWWELQQAQAAYEQFLIQPNVVWRDISKGPTFSHLRSPRYLDCTAFFWPNAPKSLVAFLGSKVFWYQLAGLTPIASGDYCRLKAQYFAGITWVETSSLAEHVDKIQGASERRYEVQTEFVRRCGDLVSNSSGKGAKGIHEWASLDFAGFRALVKKVMRSDIRVSERDEWERYFNSRKMEVESLSHRIADLETEINDRIYRMFDLGHDDIVAIDDAVESQY